MAKADLTAQHLRELLNYDQETGLFVWRVNRRGSAKVGAVAGCQTARYIVISIDDRLYLAHRLAWLYVYGAWPASDIDHRDTDKANNRIANLREATKAENNQNIRSVTSRNKYSDLLGVSWDKNRNKWRAGVTVDGKWRNLGRFNTPEEAHAIYLTEKRRVHPFCTI